MRKLLKSRKQMQASLKQMLNMLNLLTVQFNVARKPNKASLNMIRSFVGGRNHYTNVHLLSQSVGLGCNGGFDLFALLPALSVF